MVAPKIILRDTNKGQERTWESSRKACIGRLPNCEICLDDTSVSRRHAEIDYRSHEWVVRDLESVNCTFVNGACIGRNWRKLQQGDMLQCASVTLIVEHLSSVERAPVDSAKEEEEWAIEQTAMLTQQDLAANGSLSFVERCASKRNLLSITHIGRDFRQATSLPSFLDATLWEIAEVFEPQSAAFFLDEKSALVLQSHLSIGESVDEAAITANPVVRQAWQGSESIICQRCPDTSPRENREEIRAGTTIAALLRTPTKKLGVLLLDQGAQPYSKDDLFLIDALSLSLSKSIDGLKWLVEKQRTESLAAWNSLIQMVNTRNHNLEQTSSFVTDYSLLLAEALDVSTNDRHVLEMGTPLYDLGMIAVKEELLRKPQELTAQERAIVKSHVLKGAELIEQMPFLHSILPIVRNHHENWDGTGYPDRLKGENIPLVARIVAVADAFHAITSARKYRAARSFKEALQEIRQCSGRQFDPRCVQALESIYPQIEQRHELHQQREITNCSWTIEEFNAETQMDPSLHPSEFSVDAKNGLPPIGRSGQPTRAQ